jgi:hypothetical protein
VAALTGELRKSLERTVVDAREAAEAAAEAALVGLAVNRQDPFPSLHAGQKALRTALRAKMKQLGNGSYADGWHPLIEEVAYSQWHRMLFARFLAENDLLIHPVLGVAVSLEECKELAEEEGEPDEWQVAAKYASGMLPGIFGREDPSARVRYATEGRLALEKFLANLPLAVFKADDSLGWVYQFWQARKKKEVNASGKKIGARELPAVTQLFTENYMVRFLLENTLGAWWAARHPESPLLREWEYLRFREDGTPAAGTFPGWPDQAKQVTVMDPCCGSGHFLVAAFEMLRKMRMEEEGLDAREAGDAVLRANIHGLEIDPRCTQIAAFALAFAAWKSGGYREVPLPHVACSGIPVGGQLEEWTRLAGNDDLLRASLERLYHLFRNAPELGSLIDPTDVPLRDRMFMADYSRVAPLLEQALKKERTSHDPVAAVFGAAVQGVARAAELLARTYTLAATNVPYLARGKQADVLMGYCERHYAEARADLATVFIQRCRGLSSESGAYAVVTPQNWLFLSSYKRMRRALLQADGWNMLARLGSGAFETIGGEVVSIALLVLSRGLPASNSHKLAALDVSRNESSSEKAASLRCGALVMLAQDEQLENPDSRIVLTAGSRGVLLEQYAHGVHGLGTKDSPRFIRCFWEVSENGTDWELMQASVNATIPHGGMEHVVYWQQGCGVLHELARVGLAILAGSLAHHKPGVLVSQVGSLSCTLYLGGLFEKSAAVISPRNPDHTRAIWAFCSSPEYATAVRQVDQKTAVTNSTLVKVPFDLERWQKVADELYPNGLPQPYSNDPTQWLFKGDPTDSTEPLQVAVARLLGYRWPEQQGVDRLDRLADGDGIICPPPVAGEQPAHERLRALLAEAYGTQWSPQLQERLLADVGYGGKSLEAWLRDGFFTQHCKLFHNRPFIWHVWDSRKDGFSALVNYHKLDRNRLDKLIYTYLGSWINQQRARRDAGEAGADGRLVAALELQKKLEAIRDGEKPYDIYVRWKPIEKQPIGWEPDLNDGVRLNIRPWVLAGVLRGRFTINWNKDRGTDPGGRERSNDVYLTLAEKRAAREKAGVE